MLLESLLLYMYIMYNKLLQMGGGKERERNVILYCSLTTSILFWIWFPSVMPTVTKRKFYSEFLLWSKCRSKLVVD